MRCPSVRTTAVALFALAAALLGCSTPSATPETSPTIGRPPARAPDVRVGPLIELLAVETSRDKVKVVAESADQVRVLVASTELQNVLELVVRPEGVVQRRVVVAQASPWGIDAAFDAAGRFHALIDTEHLVLEGGGWRASERTPWGAAEVTAMRPAFFVAGAPNLTWAFHVRGGDVGAPGRLEIWAAGGAAGAIMWPWFTHGKRAVVVAETSTGFGPWAVLEPQAKLDTRAEALAADAGGAVSVRYTASGGGLFGGTQQRYAHIRAAVLGRGEAAIPGVFEAQVGKARYRGVTGGVAADSYSRALAADPESGLALIGLSWLQRGDDWIVGPLELPFKVRPSNLDVRVAAAGGDAFHAIVSAAAPGQKDSLFAWYLLLSEGAWSAPVPLGPTGVASFWGTGWDAYGIAGLPGGRAFVVWPTERGIVGRWVERGR